MAGVNDRQHTVPSSFEIQLPLDFFRGVACRIACLKSMLVLMEVQGTVEHSSVPTRSILARGTAKRMGAAVAAQWRSCGTLLFYLRREEEAAGRVSIYLARPFFVLIPSTSSTIYYNSTAAV